VLLKVLHLPLPREVKKEQQVEDSDSDEEMPEVDDSDEEMEDATFDDDQDVDSDEEVEQNNDDEDEEDEEESASAPALNIDSFDWTGINNRVDSSDEEEESDDEDEDDKSKDKKKKKEVEDLTAELNTNAPQTASDFERLLVGSPNSSYLWINFMAYQLQLSEIAKARDIGERALKTISFREEQEKMNVWVALLNLENNFGTDETLQEVFKRALVYCEPLKVYLQLVKIYERSDKQDKAEALWEEMTKKFGSQSPEVWTGFGLYCLQHNKSDEARELLQKSLKVLPKHEHVQTIVKFAQLEFKHGEAERGRTILEGVMSNYPKRLDLWNIYIDMEIKTGDTEMTRRLFERVASMKFSSKKMKFLFKKWIQFEKAHGTEDDVQRVKEKTLAYVESMS
jgi:rRNA biogenesis protein RRP5